MKQSPSWSATEKLEDGMRRGGNSLERKPTTASSNQSLSSRRGMRDYGSRIYETGRHSRGVSRLSEGELQRSHPTAYDYHDHPSLARSVPLDSQIPQRSNWPPSSYHSSHRSHSATNRSIQLNSFGIDVDRDSRKTLASTDSSIKLDNKKTQGPVTYVAAGTAPVASFRGSISPVSTSTGCCSPNPAYNPVHSMKRSIPFSSNLTTDDNKSDTYYRKSNHYLENPKSQHYYNDSRSSFNRRDKRNHQFYPQNTRQFSSADYFVHQEENERSALAQLSIYNSIRQELTKRSQLYNKHSDNRLSDLDLHQAMEQQRIVLPKEMTGSETKSSSLDPSPDRSHQFHAGNKQNLHPNLHLRSAATSRQDSNDPTDGPNILSGHHRVHRNSAGDVVIPENMMPMLMRIMQTQAQHQQQLQQQQQHQQQQQADDSTKKSTSSEQPSSEVTSAWMGVHEPSSVMQQLTSVVSMNQSTTPVVSKASASSSSSQPSGGAVEEQQPVRQNYSTVAARNTSSVSSDSTTQSSSSTKTATFSTSVPYSAKAALPPRPKSDKGPISPILLPLVTDVKLKDGETTEEGPSSNTNPHDNGESGYHSESSPPVVIDARPSFVPSPAVASSSSSGSKPKDLCDIKTSTSAAASCSSTSKPPTPPPTSALDRAGHFEVSKMDVLSEEIWHYHNSVTQTETMLNLKLHLRDLLYYAISPVFPMCGLYVVGSSLNGFGNNSSDMDLCLMITNKDLDQKTDAVVVLNMILNAVAQLEWVASQKLILAKVPILRIKFTAPFAKITVDLNANNSVAIKNTHLLCYYSSFDWRVRPLVSVVKEWAKRKGINDANRSSFTSYSLVLMVIHYLQCGAEPRVLPSLQQLYPKIFSSKCDVRTLNVTQTLPTPSEDWEYSEKLTLGELLIGFLDYYANKFDYDHHAISVRQGKRVDRAALTRARPAGAAGANAGAWRSQWRCICIEEPFTLSNTAHSIYDEMVFGAIKQAFSEAHLELEQTRDLQTLLSCQSIKVSMPMGGAVVYSTNYETSRATTSEAIPSVPNGLPDMNLMPSISANSLNTAHSGSSASSSNGDEVEPDSERLPFPSAISPSSSSRRSSGRNSGKRKNRRPDVNNLHSTAVRT